MRAVRWWGREDVRDMLALLLGEKTVRASLSHI